MNIVTFDIEEWYIENAFHGAREDRYEQFDRILDHILEVLNRNNIFATFFCLGKIALEFPYVIKRIVSEGHEVGCHSNQHHFLNKMTYAEVLEDTRIAIDSIEQVIGQKVLSYRAPAFSIGESNKWAFDILVECGIERDASVFPAIRDYGGFPSFENQSPCLIFHNGHTLKEFPICTTSMFGKRVAYSGGGYFRFFPLSFIKSLMEKSDYTMTYFHIGDLLPESNAVMTRKEYENYFKEKGSLINRYKRFIKANIGKKEAFNKMSKLVEQFSFIDLATADDQIDWGSVPYISL